MDIPVVADRFVPRILVSQGDRRGQSDFVPLLPPGRGDRERAGARYAEPLVMAAAIVGSYGHLKVRTIVSIAAFGREHALARLVLPGGDP